jgi:hypothetical protein
VVFFNTRSLSDKLAEYNFHRRTMHLDTIKAFIYKLMHKNVALKVYKIYIKPAPTCFGALTIIRERII